MSTGQRRQQEPERSQLVKKGPKRIRSFRFEVYHKFSFCAGWHCASKHLTASEALNGLLKMQRGWGIERDKNQVYVLDNLTGKRLREDALRELVAEERR